MTDQQRLNDAITSMNSAIRALQQKHPDRCLRLIAEIMFMLSVVLIEVVSDEDEQEVLAAARLEFRRIV